jgi:hypothetical protein
MFSSRAGESRLSLSLIPGCSNFGLLQSILYLAGESRISLPPYPFSPLSDSPLPRALISASFSTSKSAIFWVVCSPTHPLPRACPSHALAPHYTLSKVSAGTGSLSARHGPRPSRPMDRFWAPTFGCFAAETCVATISLSRCTLLVRDGDGRPRAGSCVRREIVAGRLVRPP